MPVRDIAAVWMLLTLPIAAVYGGQPRIDAMPAGTIAVEGQVHEVRVPRTPEHRAAGFQHVAPERMAGEALYYRYDPPRRPSFHMHNVARPLMLAWIAPDGRVLQVIRMRPGSDGHLAPEPVGAVLEYTGEHPLAEQVRPGVWIVRRGAIPWTIK